MGIFKSDTEIYRENLDEEMLFGIAADEISRNAISPGLYAKALSESNGNEAQARARYIKIRVAMLRTERAAVLEQEEHELRQQQKAISPPQQKPHVVQSRRDSTPQEKKFYGASAFLFGLGLVIIAFISRAKNGTLDFNIVDSVLIALLMLGGAFTWINNSKKIAEMEKRKTRRNSRHG